MTIGLLVRRVDLNEYDRELWMAAFDAARASGANLVLVGAHSSFEPDKADAASSALYSMLNPKLLDGCILSQTVALWLSQEEVERFTSEIPRLPLISTSLRFGNHPCVWVDNAAGLRRLMRHLIEDHGCRRIVHVRGPRSNREAQLREDIWREELVRARIDPDPGWLVQGHYAKQQLGGIGIRVLEQTHGEFDAVVACNDQAAFRVIEDFQARGLRVPEDYRVCGFDDNEQAQYTSPPLTTVKQPMVALLQRCWSDLEASIRDGRVPDDHTVDTTLVVRESCGCHEPQTVTGETDLGALVAEHRRTVAALLGKVQRFTEFDRAMNQVTTLDGLKSVLGKWLPRVGIVRFAILRSCTREGESVPFVSRQESGKALAVGPDSFQIFVSWPPIASDSEIIPSAHLALPAWFDAIKPCSVGIFPLVVGDTWHGLAFLELSRDAGRWEYSVQEQVAAVFHRLALEKQNLEEQINGRAKTEQLEAQKRLVSEVAHEINTPLGAILSSNATVEAGLANLLARSADFFPSLTSRGQDLYATLMMIRSSRDADPSRKQARRRVTGLSQFLTKYGLADPNRTAESLVSLGWAGEPVDLEAMASVEGFEAIVEYVCGMNDIAVSNQIIASAAEMVSNFVARLVNETHSNLRVNHPGG
jgi:DNA-binding LacI/PurR family transcriptional regulator